MEQNIKEASKHTFKIVAMLPEDLTFVSDSQDVKPIKERLGFNGYDSFFVRVENGDYSEVWGICGIIPYKSKLATHLI